MQMPVVFSALWLLQLFLLLESVTGANFARGEEQLEALLDTETQLIDGLRDYVERLELQLEEIRRETSAIEEIHSQVESVEEYMGNPLNVFGILKRFESVWPILEQLANATQELELGEGFSDMDLTLPSDEDYEESLNQLLHLQSVYELDTNSLSVGVVNGFKLGSSMSWGDCLEVARKSDFSVARFWLESALKKLPSAAENSTDLQRERESGRVHILEATLNIEYRAGELSRALATAEELLLLLPMNQSIQKAKRKIEKAMAKMELPKGRRQKSKPKKQKPKSTEQLLIEELCRGATQQVSTGSRFNYCHLDGSSPWLLLQPSRLEPISSDPYIVLHHDVLTPKQTGELLELVDEEEAKGVSYQPLKLSKLAQKKLGRISPHLGLEFGSLDPWTGRRHGHEHITKLEDSSDVQHVARAMLNLQAPGMGGAVVFPQLELGVNVPRGALLHWHTRSAAGSSSEWDYRSGQAICPVLLGVQLSAWTGLN
ncbi:prolyl 4-hydroxylase subunit alpha-1 [Drosophila yakuba]|uniref:prolyl 4-hydroxylase subunit alpha-1 n=1 Tax=Drosophila yakuba TaxID=7245 RepID=UPI001930878F|nr:prolyl 4-hydroxylase subunit alpha-1 [Drosophila yakuba]